MGQREAKQARMRELVREWRASGEAAAAFARRHGMSDNGFRYWCAQFGRSTALAKAARSAQVAFAPVRVVDDSAALSPAGLEIRLRTGDVIRADQGLPMEHLKAIIQVLRGR